MPARGDADPARGAAAVLTALGSLLVLLAGLWSAGAAAPVPSGPPSLAVMALAGAVLAGVLLVSRAWAARGARAGTAVPLAGRAAALREKTGSTAFVRQRDPDAAGRARPRAPSGRPAAART